jgi:BirA family biotin operon repressor/biotin-[acetyl-CoA-carboxylase] ligase
VTLPLLPPAYTLIALDRERAALPHALKAVARAPADGTVYWTDRGDRLEAAIVREPEAGRDATLLAHLVLMTALGDALGALLPPGKPVGLHWPDRISLDGGTIGHVACRIAPGAGDVVPPWLVLATTIQIAARPGDYEPVGELEPTSLQEEGAGDIDGIRLLEALSRHLLLWMHRWQEEGFAPVAQSWNARCPERGREISLTQGGVTHRGRLLGIDVDGRLRLGTARLGLADALALA